MADILRRALDNPRSSMLLLLLVSDVLLILLLCSSNSVHASPIRVPNLQQCELASDTSVVGAVTVIHLNCCLPIRGEAVDFSFDAYPVRRMHIRHAAHKVSDDYIEKYTRAYELMRALPDDDPRSMKVQADMHCAFCNGAYMQAGSNPSVPLQVHFSWFFLPWHRWYLYFHERILGSLIGDPGFSLVYWNWDDQRDGGNVMPAMFTRNGTALFDAKRNQAHLPPFLVSLSPGATGNNSMIENSNLNAMYQGIVTANSAELFMGGAYRTGTDLTKSTVLKAPLGGSIENGVHNGVHFWTGDPTQPLLQHMGTFTTASRDPIFFAHHSNVDRLWDIWHNHLPGGPREHHTDTDFLDAEFYFYDEDATLVKVKVRDALDNSKLGVRYKKAKHDKSWIEYDPQAVTKGSAVAAAEARGVRVIGAAPQQNGTIALGTGLTAIVRRPRGKKPRKREEVLVIEGLEVTRDSFAGVIVFVNEPAANASTSTASAEYIGTFNIIPTSSKHRHLTTNVKFEIGDNLKRIGLQNEHHIVITLAVKGNATLTIQGLKIHYQ